MRYFDLHCDTLFKIVNEDTTFDNPHLEVSLDFTKEFEHWCQCMAIWIPDELSQSERLSLFYNACKKYKNFDSKRNSKDTFILTLENASLLDNSIDNINILTENNVRMVTLTWNGENCIGGGADVQNKGLTEFGKQCVTELVNRGIIIDISHASDKTFYDVAKITSTPIVASHSNARKICSHRRNLTDEQLTEIIKREGIVGINFHKDFLNNDKTEASLKDVLLHTEYILSLDGENAVCIGSDFDGADPINELNSIRKLPDLYESYIKIGYNEQLVQKIMYYNAYNFFSRF